VVAMTVTSESEVSYLRQRYQSLGQMIASEQWQALRGSVLIIGTRVLGAAIVYLTQIGLARWLGGYQYGIYAYAWSWIVVLGFMAPLGLNVLMVRNLPDYQVRRRFARLAGQIRWTPLAVMVAGSAFAGLTACLILLFRNAIGPDRWLPLILAAACLPFFALSVLYEGIGRGFGWPLVAYGPGYVLRPVLFVAMLTMATVFGIRMNAGFAMGLMLAACMAALLWQKLTIARHIPATIATATPRYHPAAWLAAAMPFLAIETCYLILSNADVLMLGYFAPPEQVGRYFAAVRTCSFLGYIPFAVAGLALPRFSEFNSRGDRAGLARYVRSMVRWSFAAALAGAALLALIGRPVLASFGEDFVQAYPALLILLAGILIRVSTGPVEYLVAMNGHRGPTMVIIATAAVLSIALNFLLIPPLGIVGAALATALAVTFSVTSSAIFAWRKLGVRSFIL